MRDDHGAVGAAAKGPFPAQLSRKKMGFALTAWGQGGIKLEAVVGSASRVPKGCSRAGVSVWSPALRASSPAWMSARCRVTSCYAAPAAFLASQLQSSALNPGQRVCPVVDLVAASFQLSSITLPLLSGTHVSCSAHRPRDAWWPLPGQTEIKTSLVREGPTVVGLWGRGVPTFLSVWAAAWHWSSFGSTHGQGRGGAGPTGSLGHISRAGAAGGHRTLLLPGGEAQPTPLLCF